ncbi:uncharacterized protein LOC144108103 [Amblyomma americanum]
MSGMFVFTAVLLLFLSTAASVQLDTSDGGYTELRVSISNSVTPDESIIGNIKALFRSSTEFLHKATNGRVYFKHVIIEVPKTWPKRNSSWAPSSSASEKSDVLIDMPTPPYEDRPFTTQLKPCGEPGEFIHLTPGFLATFTNSTAKRFINPAYVFVHEWAHFRYGVFDDYGSLNDSRYPLTFCYNNTVRLNACSSRIVFSPRTAEGRLCSINKKCRLHRNCKVIIMQLEHDPIQSSIMFMPYFTNVSQFSDSRKGPCPHIPYAPNKQNQYCNQRSTWDVISKHDDFKNLPMPDMSKRIEVTFDEAQEDEDLQQRVALELNVSRSTRVGNRTPHMTSLTSTPVKISVRVESEPRAKDYEPILVTCKMPYLIVDKSDRAVVFAKVTKGTKSVLDAVVLARVYRPEKDPLPIKFPLHDDGEYPDNKKNDGWYGGFFVDFIGKGRYTVMVEVSNQKSTRLAYALSGSDSFLTTSFLHATTGAAPGTSFEPPSDFPELATGYPIYMFEIIDDTSDDTTDHTTGTAAETIEDYRRVADCVSAVVIRVSTFYQHLLNDFENQAEITEANVVEGNLDPKPSGAEHNVTLSIPLTFCWCEPYDPLYWHFWLAVQVSNSDGLTSTSNLVPVDCGPAPLDCGPPPFTTTIAPTTKATATRAPTSKVTTTQAVVTTQAEDAAKESIRESDFVASPFFWVGLSCIAAAIVIVIAVAVSAILNREEEEES